MKNAWVGLLVALVIGIFVGWGVRGISSSSTSLPQVGIGGGPQTPVSSSQNNKVTLNNLFIEHGVLTTLHLQAIFDGKDASASSQLLQSNGQQIANFIGSTYGAKAQANFLSMWQQHITDYETYTKALKANDANGMTTAKNNLATLSQNMGTYFHNLNSTLSASQVASLMQDHVNLTLSIINDYAQNNQVAMVNHIKEATDQAVQFAAYFTSSSAPTPSASY